MEKLTGKCYIDFQEWLFKKHNTEIRDFVKTPEIVQNAIIIEFLDRAQIYIQDWGFIDHVIGKKPSFDVQVNCYPDLHSVDENNFFQTRTEAINAGIKKANEIYNN